MTYSRKPNYGVLFFSFFVAFFFVILPNIFGYFGLYQLLLVILSLLAFYSFLRSKAILTIDNGYVLSSYPYLHQQSKIGLSEILALNVTVHISFAYWQQSATGDASPRSGYGVQFRSEKKQWRHIDIKVVRFLQL